MNRKGSAKTGTSGKMIRRGTQNGTAPPQESENLKCCLRSRREYPAALKFWEGVERSGDVLEKAYKSFFYRHLKNESERSEGK